MEADERQGLHAQHVTVARLHRQATADRLERAERIARAAERDRSGGPRAVVQRRARGRVEEERRGLGEAPRRREDLATHALHGIEARCFDRVGGTKAIHVDVRWIAAVAGVRGQTRSGRARGRRR